MSEKTNFERYLEEQLKDPEVRAEFELRSTGYDEEHLSRDRGFREWLCWHYNQAGHTWVFKYWGIASVAFWLHGLLCLDKDEIQKEDK